MIEIIIAVLSLEVCVVGLIAQLFSFARKDAREAASDRAMIHSSIELINYRIEQIERRIELIITNKNQNEP
jgi:hypothetical protein